MAEAVRERPKQKKKKKVKESSREKDNEEEDDIFKRNSQQEVIEKSNDSTSTVEPTELEESTIASGILSTDNENTGTHREKHTILSDQADEMDAAVVREVEMSTDNHDRMHKQPSGLEEKFESALTLLNTLTNDSDDCREQEVYHTAESSVEISTQESQDKDEVQERKMFGMKHESQQGDKDIEEECMEQKKQCDFHEEVSTEANVTEGKPPAITDTQERVTIKMDFDPVKATVHTTTEVSQNDIGKDTSSLYPELTGLATSADLDDALSKIKEEYEKLSSITAVIPNEGKQTFDTNIPDSAALPVETLGTKEKSIGEKLEYKGEEHGSKQTLVLNKVPESTAPPMDSMNVREINTREKLVYNGVETGRQKQKWLTIEQLQSLYYNPQLARNSTFLDLFVQNEKKKDSHEFYEILMSYLRARRSLMQAESEIHTLQESYTQMKDQAWITTKHSVNARGPCGDGAMCKTTHLYDVAEFNDATFDSMKKTLANIRHNLQNQLVLHSYSSQLARLQVESYIHAIFTSSPLLRDIPKNAPVHACDHHGYDTQHQVNKLRECISVLFTFHRRPIKDDEFIKSIRSWTQRLVSALVRVASYDDHLFILNHVLRCPAGVGLWAVSLIQVPAFPLIPCQSSFGCSVLDHIITCLSTILMPIREREDFICLMKEAVTPDPQNQANNWIMVDSDGEEDEDPQHAWQYLHENDFVSILSQFPMAALFKHVLCITTRADDSSHYDPMQTTEASFLKLIAFCTCLVNILGCGLQTYNMPRYKQLNKRLGKMIRTTVQYVSDHWENFLVCKTNILPAELLNQLQLEYNCFFLRSTSCILSAHRLGSWQFMVNMPYSTVSEETVWQLLWLLHHGRNQIGSLEELPSAEDCKTFVANPESKAQLADVINCLPTSEVIFLLTALANMAQTRQAHEVQFIEAISFDLFEICYVCSETREACSKVGRELLVSVAIAHPFILSLLIQGTKKNMDSIGMMALYLFKELPFHLWLPCQPDLAVIRHWLLNFDLSQPQNQLARYVLSKVNWGIDHLTNRLFVPYEVHVQIAVLLTEAYGKFITNKQLGFFLFEGVKQVASAMRQQQTNEQVFNNWAWEIAMKLHLHHNSLPRNDAGVVETEGDVPVLANEKSLMPIFKGLNEQNAMACFMSIVISEFGHVETSFLTEGVEELLVVVEQHHYHPTLHCLNYIIPMYVNRPSYLTMHESILRIVHLLLGADDSYAKISKMIWSHDFPGPITKMIACMIKNQAQRMSRSSADGSRPLKVLSLWLQLLTNDPKWYLDRNACYLADMMIKSAFYHKDGLVTMEVAFHDAFKRHVREGQSSSAMSTFVSWVASGVACTTVPSLLEKIASPEKYGWLSYLILDLESAQEMSTKLWPGLKDELSTDSKQTIEQALKKTITKLKLDVAPGVNSLCVYQWSRLALGLPTDHSILLLVWQRFFGLFLGRQVSQISMQQRASVGEKCFEHAKHSGDLKKMKRRLGEIIDYHINYQPATPDSTGETTADNLTGDYNPDPKLEDVNYVASKDFHLELSRMFQTFQFWVQEPMLHDAKLYLPALPQQYQSERLLQLFQNQIDPWYEYVDMDRIVYEVAQLSSEWDNRLVGDDIKLKCQHLLQPTVSATDRILIRLLHHDPAVDLPSLPPQRALVPEISTTVIDEKPAIIHLLKTDLNVMKDYAKSFHARVAKHVANDDDFCKLLPQHYYNKSTQVKVTIECKSLINPLHKCSNPAVVNVNIRERTVNENTQRQIDENRAEFKQLMIEGLSPPPLNVCVAAVHVENAITMLVKLFRTSTNDTKLLHYNDVACTLFYLMAEMVNDDTEFYPPSRQFFSACIDMLGQEFIEKDANQTEIILQFSFNSPTMASLMSHHFVPINNPYTYVTMYERLVQILQQQNPDLVFMLLTKFEIDEWLKLKNPAPIEIKRFLDILGTGICSCGSDPDVKHAMVLEICLKHLQSVITYQFPAYMSHAVTLVLQGTADQQLNTKCWQVLHQECFPSERNHDGLEEQTGQSVCLMSIDQIREVLNMMAQFFFQLRTGSAEFGNFGLYPKLATYVPFIQKFIQELLYSLIDKIMISLGDMNAEQTLDMLWNTTIQTYSPWIQPLQTETNPLLPWIQADMETGAEMVQSFRDVLEHINQNFLNVIPPYQPDILTKLWLYFVGTLCHKEIPAHITIVYNTQFENLPWNQLRPSFDVLNSMIKVKEVNSPESFDLLAHAICEMNWTDILHFYQQYYPGEGHSQVLGYLLVLLMQCYGDQKHIEIPALEQKTLAAESYNWQSLKSDNFRHASNWFLQTCDPKCILAERSSSVALGLRLLKAASGFGVQASSQWTSELSAKRQCYVHSVIQLMCQCTFEKDINLESLSTILINLMTEIETVTSSVVDLQMQNDETLDLVKEVFGLLNNCNPENESLTIVMTTIVQWLQSSPSSNLLMPCVRAASRCLASHTQMVQIIEECIHVYFKGGLDKQTGGGWDHVLAAIQIPDLNIEEYLNAALEEGSYLLLYGYVVQKQPLCAQLTHERVLINQILEWSTKVKPSLDNESKLLLLWDKCIELCLRQVDYGCEHSVIIKLLTALIHSLHAFGEDRATGGLLGAIGLGKRSVFSSAFRIISRSLSAMISVQLISDSKIRIQPTDKMASNSLSKQEVGALQSMKTNKAYNQYKEEIQTVWDFVQNPSHCLRESLGLIAILCSAFYPEKEFLSVIHNRSS